MNTGNQGDWLTAEDRARAKMFAKVAAIRNKRDRRSPPELREYNPMTGQYEVGPRKRKPTIFELPPEPEEEDDGRRYRRPKSDPAYEAFGFPRYAIVRAMREESDLAARIRTSSSGQLWLEVNLHPDILAQSPRLITRIKTELRRIRHHGPTGLSGAGFHANTVGKH